ncbi:enoyl-CoA hydratase/isomerase family protein [Variovorax terrae]|uniref:Enoyl-CoA hydratase/isomerase family protein n=1 Tax=Variovorax terrae TaxID=2923278 RepID=A0A9X2ALN7_9BURK|nr:enoyl-CoA hydratase/isomerase family protein [Variovorax terrae]MCJ0762888.1 enoyl-CoA hydratase/isomerase family protein [Variovorax terrae]
MAGHIALDTAGPHPGLAFVTLSHPGKLNAMSRAMWRELRAVFEQVQRSGGIRCVVIRGEAGQFCAGGDIAEYPGFRFEEAGLRDFHERDVWGGLQALLDCDVPLVAQIEGACMGAGVEIASCCDIRIAAESARFGAPIARLGFPMAPREAQLVMRAAGELTAREMLLEAAVLDAAEMKARGFLHRVVDEGQAAEQALQAARRVAALAPQAARLNKQTFRALNRPEVQVHGSSAAMDLIANAYRYADSDEHREGIQAFIEKRTPRFLTPP